MYDQVWVATDLNTQEIIGTYRDLPSLKEDIATTWAHRGIWHESSDHSEAELVAEDGDNEVRLVLARRFPIILYAINQPTTRWRSFLQWLFGGQQAKKHHKVALLIVGSLLVVSALPVMTMALAGGLGDVVDAFLCLVVGCSAAAVIMYMAFSHPD